MIWRWREFCWMQRSEYWGFKTSNLTLQKIWLLPKTEYFFCFEDAEQVKKEQVIQSMDSNSKWYNLDLMYWVRQPSWQYNHDADI